VAITLTISPLALGDDLLGDDLSLTTEGRVSLPDELTSAIDPELNKFPDQANAVTKFKHSSVTRKCVRIVSQTFLSD